MAAVQPTAEQIDRVLIDLMERGHFAAASALRRFLAYGATADLDEVTELWEQIASSEVESSFTAAWIAGATLTSTLVPNRDAAQAWATSAFSLTPPTDALREAHAVAEADPFGERRARLRAETAFTPALAFWRRRLEQLETPPSGMQDVDEMREQARRRMTSPSRWQSMAFRMGGLVTGAFSAGSMAAAIDEGLLVRVWRTQGDAKVRRSHREASGQCRPIGEPFMVEGFPLRYPGDPRAPFDLWINCRCYVQYRLSCD